MTVRFCIDIFNVAECYHLSCALFQNLGRKMEIIVENVGLGFMHILTLNPAFNLAPTRSQEKMGISWQKIASCSTC